jgi:hypothetical protein
MLIIALIPIIICLWVAFKKRLSFLGSVQLSCLGFALSALIVIVSTYLITGTDIANYYLNYYRQLFQQNEAITKGYYALIQMVTGGEINSQISLTDAFNAIYPYFQSAIIYGIPAMFAIYIPIGGLVSYLIVHAIAKKAGANVIHVPPFAEFKLPAKFGRWSVIILIICLFGLMFGWRNFDFVLTIAFAFFGSIYYVLGMSFMEWALKKQIKSAVGRGFIIALLAIVFSQLYIFAFLGLLEQLVKIRRRADSKKVGL